MQLCEYGCGQEAKHQFKNGKWCCSKNWGSCPPQRKKNSMRVKEIHKDPDSVYNSDLYREKLSKSNKKARKDPNSIFNLKSYKENHIKRMKKLWDDPNSKFNSILWKKKHQLSIKQINEKYPFFSKIEEMRYNPDKSDEKEIQVHCKNHNCKNSKEKDGWFTPTPKQITDRKNLLENEGLDNSYFYCSQECKDICPLYNLHGDPYKDINFPYTPQERQLWRQTVLELDKYICQYCGKPARDVHHIKPVKTHPHLALDPDNGISFCKECHHKIGHKDECSTGNLANKQGCSLGGQI